MNNNIEKSVISLLDQLKSSGQLNEFLANDDERVWIDLVYDILVNKLGYPFGNKTKSYAKQVYDNAVVAWKGKGKMTDLMSRTRMGESKKLIKLSEKDLRRIIKESVKRTINENWLTGKKYGTFNRR